MTVSQNHVALIGADTLLGTEIKEVLESNGSVSIDNFAANGEANFGEEEGEPVYRQALSSENLANSSVAISAGAPEGAAKALSIAAARGGDLKVIDCTGALDQQPEARIASPFLDATASSDWLLVLPHPASSVIALLLSRLALYQKINRALVEVFEPASERGRLGLAELQQQTTSLLAFKTLDKKIYDAQVSFAMLPAYGEKSVVHLQAIEQRIETHLATLLGNLAQQKAAVPMPSLRLIQAPVFHGYTFSLWVEFEDLVQIPEVEAVLETDSIDVRSAEHEMPTNVGIAGMSGLGVGDIRIDRNNPRAVWLWAVADNLRIVADQVNDLLRKWKPATK
jgi:aspartate-semialdehyde dehydrogenase